MDTRKASRVSWKHIICCLILLLIFVFTVGIHINAKGESDGILATSDVVPLAKSGNFVKVLNVQSKSQGLLAGPNDNVTISLDKLNYYINTYNFELNFLSNTFGVNYQDIIDDLNSRHQGVEDFDFSNIGLLLNEEGNVKKYNNNLYGLVEYFYDYVERNPKKVNKKWVPYTGNADYVEKLIMYFTTNIYDNVDVTTALSIGAAESGYYTVDYMLRCNNVFGGMSSNGLTKFKNIEFGVLSYIRMLSRNYYGSGLTTVSAIGKRYCPTYDSFGNKIASPHWINLVNKASNKYKDYETNVNLQDLLNLKGNA